MKVDRRYSQVVRTIWSHPKFASLPAAKPNPQTLVLRLLIAPESGSVPGLFKAWDTTIARDLGWPLAAFNRCLAQVVEAEWAQYDAKTGVIWVPGAIDQDANQPANPNVVRGWRTTFGELPECDLKRSAIAKFQAWAEAKSEAWVTALEEALGQRPPAPSANPSGKTLPKVAPKPLGEPSPKTRPIQEKEKEKEQEAGRPAGSRAERFHEFERSTGERPSARRDLAFEKFPIQKWFPSQQILDWVREMGISEADYDAAMVEARDKLSGAHDIEWWDPRILSFIEQKSQKRTGQSGSESVVFSP
jgi:hypothetical protein